MGILDKIIGGGVVSAVEGIGNVIDKFIETDQEKEVAKQIMARIALKPSEAQNEINKIQAGHRSMFVAGARPFILWVCGIGLMFTFLLNPILQWLTGNPGPALPNDIIMELVLGILGLGGLRTIEKLSGKAK